ncbi:hypothetical protein NP493_28g09035 [Ridgeia piscesae]|uniref:Large ribosomal subunit protein mL53 n=1 Tax=Ridgeia piscesae TaxID=27915 RepID=A0AAD9UKG1_RIDPI|nr:hypothetical protein NP493_28g09035 [Ridgeia piscesae]
MATLSLRRAVAYHYKSLRLTAVKQVIFKFDPFHEHTKSVREFMHHVNVPKIRQTNLNCSVKIDVVSDRTEPRVEVKFANDDRAIFKTENLTTLEIIKNFNEMCRERESSTS